MEIIYFEITINRILLFNSKNCFHITYNQCCPEGGVGGVAPWKISQGKISKGGPMEKLAEVHPPLENFVWKKYQRGTKVKFNPPSNFGNFQS
jgi:hypothetical protein